MQKVEHIGIAVKDIRAANAVFAALLGNDAYKEEMVESEHVITSFFRVGETKIELLMATDPESAIAKFLDKNREGIHHIAFDVDDIETELARLESLGFSLIHKTPKAGADGKIIAFLHPKSTAGVLVELCQDRG
ncbi:MAG: methylmalonyl-CoA epimerase [Flavobacteriales bacterium]|nr:methylmalonyl-CoA epimerase [Flavobacteriales bacterium]